MKQPSSWTGAFEVVRACARPSFSEAHREDVRRRVSGDTDWAHVTRLARLHGVQPIVYRRLQEAFGDDLPPEVREHIEQYREGTTFHNIFLARELARLLDRFEAHGVRALALKGPVLAQRAYGDVRLRPFVDVDVLIPEKAFERVEDLLLDDQYQHYAKVQQFGEFKKKLFMKITAQCPFRRGAGVFNLDVHVQLMPPGYYYPVPFDTFWQRSECLSIAGGAVRTFSDEDLLQILCYHGIKNQWATLKHVCDVAMLVTSSEIEWDVVRERAEAIHGMRSLHLGLGLARDVLGATLPEAPAEALKEDVAIQRLLPMLETVMRERHERTITYAERIQMQWLTKETLATKLRYVAFSAAQNLWAAVE